MSFISLLLGIIADRYLPALSEHRGEGWFRSTFAIILRYLPSHTSLPGLALALVAILIPAAITWIGLELLWSFEPAIGFIAGFLIFLFMLGPRGLFTDLHDYTEAVRNSDEETANRLAGELLEATPPEDATERTRHVIQRILVLGGRRLFSVLFWAALLGPAGAVLFRAADILRHRAEATGCPDHACGPAGQVYGLMEWAPSRLLAMSYALAGSFDEAMAERQAAFDACSGRFFEINEDILACTGRGALMLAEPDGDAAAELDATRNMLFRALVIWLAVLAVLSLIGITL